MTTTMPAEGLKVKRDQIPSQLQGGSLIGGARLRSALGFDTGEAFRAAVRAGRVPVRLTKIAGRRGWFARTKDVVDWLTNLQVQGGSSERVVVDRSEEAA